MKKSLLIATAALLAVSPAVSAQNPDDARHSENLTLVWYGVPTGNAADATKARSGVGVNGKFYIVLQNNGVAVYNNDGQIKMISCTDAWVSINCDDAGHVYFRNDKLGWAGPEGAGWFLAENARFSVIDSRNDEIIKANVPMTNNVSKCRFDALPHIYGDMMTDDFEIAVPNNGAGNRVSEFLFTQTSDGMEVEQNGYNVYLNEAIKMFPSPANGVQTLGSAQIFGDSDYMAVLPNNYYNITSSLNGWGNNIALFEFDGDEYKFTGKYFNTPNHSSVGGFVLFEYAGQEYVVYPTGMYDVASPAGDGFFVMPMELVDTPQNKTATEDPELWSDELHKAVATHYATEGIPSGNNYRGINVEPVEGEEGVFNLYFFDPGKSMQMWKLDLTMSAGISDIRADKGEASIFGGVGMVVVDGASKAQVYTPAGVLVAEGQGQIPVAKGLYIVRAGNASAKVIVK